MKEIVGEELGNKLKDISLELYKTAAEYALTKGIIIADTKFEFGMVDGELILIDKVLTPDSSRFWPAKNSRFNQPPAALEGTEVLEVSPL